MQAITKGSDLADAEVTSSSMDLTVVVVQSLPFVTEIGFTDKYKVNSLQECNRVQWYDWTSEKDCTISPPFMVLTESNYMDGLWVEIVSKAPMYTKKDFFFLRVVFFFFFFCQNRTEGVPQNIWNTQLIFL